jgi:hypothetical protein
MRCKEANQGRRVLAADDVARKGAIVQDERASYACAPHRILALPLISPCALEDSYTPGYMHPRTPLFRAAAGLSPAAIQCGRRETSRLIAGIIPCATGRIRCGAPPEVMDTHCIVDATRSPRYTGTRVHDGAIPRFLSDPRHKHDSGRGWARRAGSSRMGGWPYDVWRG